MSQKTTLMLHTIDSTHINRILWFLAEMMLREYAIEWFIIPPLLTNVSALPRETWTRKLSFQYATGVLENVGGSEQNRSVANVQSDDLWRSRRPTDVAFWKISKAISRERVVRSTSCLTLGRFFRGRRIEWTSFRLDQIQDHGRQPSCKFWMAISLIRFIRSYSYLVLGLPRCQIISVRCRSSVQEKIMREE